MDDQHNKQLPPKDRRPQAHDTSAAFEGDRPGDQPDPYSDEQQYDDINTGKYEQFEGRGYYGSNYGFPPGNAGRDYEQNAGYRDSYNRLPVGQWPEVEEAQRRRGIEDARYLHIKGLHQSKGPRSYQRSDVRIEDDVNDLLTDDPYIDATDIEVTVENCEVILNGTVEDKNMKRRVEDVIENIRGVKNIQNRLRTRLEGNHIVNIESSRRRGV